MTTIHALLDGAFSLMLDPLRALGPTWALVVVSFVSGVLLLAGFRVLSNPDRVRVTRKRAEAELLAVRLYRHDVRTVLRAQGRFLLRMGSYVGSFVRPLLVLAIPVGLLLAHLEARHGARPLRVGETAVVEAVGKEDWALEAEGPLVVEAGPVRVAGRRELSWRIRATGEGDGRLVLSREGAEVGLSLPVGRFESVDPAVSKPGWGAFFTAPTRSPLDPSLAVDRVWIRLPRGSIAIGPWETDWIVLFLVISLAAGFALKRRFGVEL